MKKYLVVDYYSWEGDFGLHATEICDTEQGAIQKQLDLLNESVKAWIADGTRVVLGAENMSNEQLDGLPVGTIIVEYMGQSILITEYGRSSINHEEIIYKEVEV